jgi:hypothetical protein
MASTLTTHAATVSGYRIASAPEEIAEEIACRAKSAGPPGRKNRSRDSPPAIQRHQMYVRSSAGGLSERFSSPATTGGAVAPAPISTVSPPIRRLLPIEYTATGPRS